MDSGPTLHSTARVAGRPVHPMMVALPITLLIAVFACDVLFFATGAPLLPVVAFYALAAGVVLGALAGIVGFIDYLGNRRIRRLRAANVHMAGNLIILFLSAANFLLRQDMHGSVPLGGLILSGVVFAAIHLTGWMGWTMVYRHGVGVDTDHGKFNP